MSRIGNKDLARYLVDRYDIDRAAAEQLVAHMFDVLNDGLRDEKQVKVKGLGTFKVTSVASRKSVDVNTGEPIIIEGRDKINFTADNALRDQVNRPFAQFETVVLKEGVEFDEIDQKFADSMTESSDDEDSETTPETGKDTPVVAEAPVEPAVSQPSSSPVAAADSAELQPQPAVAAETEQLVISSDLLAQLNGDPRPKAEAVDEKTTEDDKSSADLVSETVDEGKDGSAPDAASSVENRQNEVRLMLNASQLAVLNGQKPIAEEPEPSVAEAQTENASVATEVGPVAKQSESEPLLQVVETSSDAVDTPQAEQEDGSDGETELDLVRNQALELSDKVENQHRLMKIVIGVAAVLVAACIGGVVWMATQLEMRNNRIQHLEAEAQQAVPSVAPTVKPKSQVDTLALAQARADSIAAAQQKLQAEQAAQAKAAALAEAEAKEKARLMAEAQKVAEVKKQAEAKMQEEARRAAAQKQAGVKAAAAQSGYNQDVRVRTGAYIITGIDRTVTVRAGQTLASISKANLGPGMECYVEAVNGGRTEFKAGDKVKIPALKLKKR